MSTLGRVTIGSAVAFVLAAASVALAGAVDRPKIRLSAADNAVARAAVLRRADLGSGANWQGGARKPDLSPEHLCPHFNPKQSDLVLTGIAESIFSEGTLAFDSQTQVLQTPRMLQLNWQRSVVAPGLLSCLRTTTAKSSPPGTVVSIAKLAFPRVATYTAAFRLTTDVHTPGGTVRLFVDLAMFGRGRTQITLTTSGPYSARVPVKAAEIRLAKVLATRIRS